MASKKHITNHLAVVGSEATRREQGGGTRDDDETADTNPSTRLVSLNPSQSEPTRSPIRSPTGGRARAQ
eukprot:3496839-Rhodomonas_salina.1